MFTKDQTLIFYIRKYLSTTVKMTKIGNHCGKLWNSSTSIELIYYTGKSKFHRFNFKSHQLVKVHFKIWILKIWNSIENYSIKIKLNELVCLIYIGSIQILQFTYKSRRCDCVARHFSRINILHALRKNTAKESLTIPTNRYCWNI